MDNEQSKEQAVPVAGVGDLPLEFGADAQNATAPGEFRLPPDMQQAPVVQQTPAVEPNPVMSGVTFEATQSSAEGDSTDTKPVLGGAPVFSNADRQAASRQREGRDDQGDEASSFVRRMPVSAFPEGRKEKNGLEPLDNYGHILRAAREKAHLSFDDVEDQTRIAKYYLQALEEEDIKHLPPPVYIVAYVRRLCAFYKLDQETSDRMVLFLRQNMHYSVTDELINRLDVDREPNEENDRKVRQILWALGAMVAVVVALIVFGVFWIVRNSTNRDVQETNTMVVSTFDESRLEGLRQVPQLKVNELQARP